MSVDTDNLPSFGSLSISNNDDGWGPSQIPDKFKNMPFQPFSKDTRLGKIADWCGSIHPELKNKNRYNNQYSGGAQYSYYHDEDDSNFQLANVGKEQKSGGFRNRFKFQFRARGRGGMWGYSRGGPGGGNFRSLGNFGSNQRRPMDNRNPMNSMQGNRGRYSNQQGGNWNQNRRGGGNAWGGGGGNWRNGQGDYNRRITRTTRNPSCQIKDDWTLLEDMEFSQFSGLSLPSVKEPVNLIECGTVKYYDRAYDATSTRNEKPLVRFKGVVHAVTTTNDPIIHRLVKESNCNVFLTDRMAAAIMCSTKSVDSWDLLAIRVEDKLFFDFRSDSNFDLITVAETAVDPPNEETGHINSPEKLALEATFINVNFPQQVLQAEGKQYSFPEKNPFIDGDDDDDEDEAGEDAEAEAASVGYRYRQFDLGGGIQMVIRCEVDAVLPNRDHEKDCKEIKFASIKALNEFDSRYCNGVNWRSKLDNQRGAVIASELKNNSFKLSKWTVGAIMSGADQLKLGFVSRVTPTDTANHVILGMAEFRPADFASQINLNMDNAWGILRCFVDYFMKREPGQYLMLKDPNKPVMHIYSLPKNAFASDEESDDDK